MNQWLSFSWMNNNMYLTSMWATRIVLSLVVLLGGFIAAKKLTQWIRRGISHIFGQKAVADSPLGVVSDYAVSLRGSGILSTVVFWLIFILFLSIAGEILGIYFFTQVLAMILRTIPALVSAFIVFVLGVMLAGVVERVVKQQLKRVAPQQAVLTGTLSSYVVLALFGLIALSELGVASEFILVLFTGVVMTVALAVGISLGFGSKDLVAEMLENMVHDEQQSRQKKSR